MKLDIELAQTLEEVGYQVLEMSVGVDLGLKYLSDKLKCRKEKNARD